MLSRVWSGDRKVTQGFSSTHNGLDVSMPNGTPLYAPEDGSIYANVTVPERNGEKYNAFRSTDGKRVLICVHIGSFEASGQVKAGQLTAKSDNTGISSGPHCHFTFRVNGVETNPMDYLTGGGDMTIPNADNWYGRFNKLMVQIRGRELPREEFTRNFVGKDTFGMVESLSDNPEADAATNAQVVGQVAVRDNWEGQINSLQTTVSQLKDSMVEQTKEIDSLDKQVNKQTTKIAELEAKVVELSTPSTDDSPTPPQTVAEPTFSSVLESIRLLIKKWLGVN